MTPLSLHGRLQAATRHLDAAQVLATAERQPELHEALRHLSAAVGALAWTVEERDRFAASAARRGAGGESHGGA